MNADVSNRRCTRYERTGMSFTEETMWARTTRLDEIDMKQNTNLCRYQEDRWSPI